MSNETIIFDVEDPIIPPQITFVYNYYVTDEKKSLESMASPGTFIVDNGGLNNENRFADGALPPRFVRIRFKFCRGPHQAVVRNQGNNIFMNFETGAMMTTEEILRDFDIRLPETALNSGRSNPVRFQGLLNKNKYGAASQPQIKTEGEILSPIMSANSVSKDNRRLILRLQDLIKDLHMDMLDGEYDETSYSSSSDMADFISNNTGTDIDSYTIKSILSDFNSGGIELERESSSQRMSREISDNPSNSKVVGVVDNRVIRDMNNRPVRMNIDKKHQLDIMNISVKCVGALSPITYDHNYFLACKEAQNDAASLSPLSAARFGSLADQMMTSAIIYEPPYNENSGGALINITEDFNLNDLSQIVLVGHVVEKFRIESGGKKVPVESLLFMNDYDVHEAANRPEIIFNDTKVRYGDKYSYQSRYLYCVRILDVDINDAASGKTTLKSFLVMSRESEDAIVACEEFTPPPPPTVMRFRFDYTNERGLIMFWQIPRNNQEDIVKYQIFRRKTIFEPFELIREVNFDKSIIKTPSMEYVRDDLISYHDRHTVLFKDEDYTRNDKYIYAVCSIDAHGFTSNYSPQTEISFDRDNNKLSRKTISNIPCPKQYPNLYINPTDAGVASSPRITEDVMKISGFDTMRIYFDPEYVFLDSGDGRQLRDRQLIAFAPGTTSELAATTNIGNYKFQIINTDRQKVKNITMKIGVDEDNNLGGVSGRILSARRAFDTELNDSPGGNSTRA